MEKKGLGKGLGALIPGGDSQEKGPGTEIEISRISANPYQPRGAFDEEKLQDLTNSIRVHGVLQPIVVRSKGSGDYELVAGERRFRAATAAGLSRIPAVIRELTNEQSLQVALIENVQREDINSVDAAVAYKRLIDEFGLSQEDLAFAIGKSRSAVANTMRIMSLPESILEYIKSGDISEGHARAMLAVQDRDEQEELCERIIREGLSVRETERIARGEGGRGAVPRKQKIVSRETFNEEQDPNILDIEARLREVLGTKVSLIRNKDKGRIEIEFYSDDDLERILYLLAGA